MYLTRFQLNPQRRGATKLLMSPQVVHAAVLAGFPDPAPTDEGRVLWRLDTDGPKAALYIVSPERPDLTHLVEQAGWPTRASGWDTRDYGQLLGRLDSGQRWAFRLGANPAHSVRAEPERRGKPRGHVTAAQQEQWLLDRADGIGVSFTDASGESLMRVTRRDTVTFQRRQAQITLRTARFEGLLTVTDPQRFSAALTHGIGRAKGYGCGLLTLASVR